MEYSETANQGVEKSKPAAWYDEYIGQVPGVVGGEPVIKDTRFSVLAVVEYVELYGSLQRVAEIFPNIPPECFRAGLAYYEDHTDEIEGYRREEEESDAEIEDIPNLFRISA